MDRFGLKYGNRKVGPMCLLPHALGLPVRHHSHDVNRSPGEFIAHNKHLTSEFIKSGGMLKYDKNTNMITLPEKSLIRHAMNKGWYVIENGKKRRFYTWAHLYAYNFTFESPTYELFDSYFDTIPLGDEIGGETVEP